MVVVMVVVLVMVAVVVAVVVVVRTWWDSVDKRSHLNASNARCQ